VRDKDYRLVKFSKQQFFGYTEVEALGLRVWISDVEKTILDCLYRPQYAGGIPDVAVLLRRGQMNVQWERLVDYAPRFQSSPLIQRLGYLCEILKVPLAESLREKLLSRIGQGNTYLGSWHQWSKGGDFNSTWRVVDNIPHRELLAEVGGPV
jgi:predicted transcriptional regulator of viral defense system